MKQGLGEGGGLPGGSWARSLRHRQMEAVIGQLVAAVQRRVGVVGESDAQIRARGGASRGLGVGPCGAGFGAAGYAHAPWRRRCRRGEGSGRDGWVRVGVQGERHRAANTRAGRGGRL